MVDGVVAVVEVGPQMQSNDGTMGEGCPSSGDHSGVHVGVHDGDHSDVHDGIHACMGTYESLLCHVSRSPAT